MESDLNKTKQAVVCGKKSGASGNPLPINPEMKSWQDAAGKNRQMQQLKT
jgi:hypothetical protein